MTNREFANTVGCSTTTASRMRNGKRAPSIVMLSRVIDAFGLDSTEAVARADTPERWGAYLRNTVFSRTGVRAGAQLESVQPGDQPAGELVEGTND